MFIDVICHRWLTFRIRGCIGPPLLEKYIRGIKSQAEGHDFFFLSFLSLNV